MISVENRKIFLPPPGIFCASADGVPLGIWYRRTE